MSRNLSKFKKEVYTLSLQNKSTSTISTILEKPYKSIYNTLQRIKKKKDTIIPLSTPKLGRPTKVSKRTTRVVNRDLERSPKKTNKRILEENNLDFSTRSLQRLLRVEKYSLNTLKKKQLLNAEKASNRKKYAKKTLKIIRSINFNKVIFSDESSIQRRHGARQEYYRKRRNNKVGKELVSTTNTSKFKKNLNRLKDLSQNLVLF
jgi:transposase